MKTIKEFFQLVEKLDGKSSRDPNYSLKNWFNDEWVQTGGKYDGKPCARQPGQTTKPYCRDPDDRANMSEKERDAAARKKRRNDPNPDRSGEAKIVTQEAAGEKDACYKKVKSRYKIWPSAYASGALVRCRRVGASNWGNKSEETMKTFKQFLEQIGHVNQTTQQQINARQLDMSKRRRHSNIVKSTISRASSYDKQQQHDIKDIEDRRS